MPVAAPAMPSTTDQAALDIDLVQAADDLQAADRAIGDLCKKFGDDADSREDYLALEDRRNEHIATLVTVRAKSMTGIEAKAVCVRLRELIEDYTQHQQVAVSLADDLVQLGPQSIIRPLLAAAVPKGSLDPVFALIAAHRDVNATVHAIEAEAERLLSLGIDDTIDITGPSGAEMDLFLELLEIVPNTLAGVVALVTYLDEIHKKDPWKFEDNYATPLIGNLAEAFNRFSAAS
jgi:hypothetical protein